MLENNRIYNNSNMVLLRVTVYLWKVNSISTVYFFFELPPVATQLSIGHKRQRHLLTIKL